MELAVSLTQTLGTLHYKYYFRMREVEDYTRGAALMGARRSRGRGRVARTAGSSKLSGRGGACGESKTIDLQCNLPFNRKARSVVEGFYRLYTHC